MTTKERRRGGDLQVRYRPATTEDGERRARGASKLVQLLAERLVRDALAELEQRGPSEAPAIRGDK